MNFFEWAVEALNNWPSIKTPQISWLVREWDMWYTLKMEEVIKHYANGGTVENRP